MTAERKAGIAAGSLVGIVAGLLIADAGDDSEQIAGGVVGAAAGGTLGDLTARALSEPGCEPGPRRTRSATAPQVGHADTSHRTYDRFMREKAREKRD